MSQMYATVSDAGTIVQTQYIALPESATLEQCWAALGFALPEGGYEPKGLYRRLEAGLQSILNRGTASGELQLGSDQDGWRPVQWESVAGRWTNRHWRVSGWLAMFDGVIAVENCFVEVESSARRDQEGVLEWTTFYGGPLNTIIQDRLQWVLAQFGARFLAREEAMLEEWVTDLLTDEEIKGFHDLGTSPIAAWISPFGRVVLEDDSDGRARIHGPEVEVYIARRIPTIGLDEARRLWRDLKLAHPRLAAYALSGLYRRTATRA
jgi:hypothetical protein